MNTGLEPVDNGSNYPFRDKMLKGSPARSAFDWSHSCVFSLENAGLLFPVFCAEVLPDSDYEINANILLRVLPQVVPLYSNQRYYLYAFYARYSDLFRRAKVYMTKGYSGNEVLTKPILRASNISQGSLDYTVVPGDLYSCLGLQIGKKLSEFGSVNALPFFMYEKIYNDYFINNNLHINDRVRLPDDPGDFRLNDDGTIISNVSATSDFPAVKYGQLRYRDYPQDYYTSALPFQQRGNAPTLSFSLNTPEVPFNTDFKSINFAGSLGVLSGVASDNRIKLVAESVNSGSTPLLSNPQIQMPAGSNVTDIILPGSGSTIPSPGRVSQIRFGSISTGSGDGTITGMTLPSLAFEGGFTLDQFRNLAVATAELERLARTDGSFAQFGLTFFGEKSRNSNDYFVTFVGGSYRRIAFSEVLQTGGSQPNGTPLGTYAGHGIISDNGYLGHLHSDEHGYLMIILSVMPDVYYSQGLPKMFSRLTQVEEFLPGRDKLGLTAIFNRELYVSGNAGTDADLFAYQEPFDDYRYKENRIIGKMADPSNNSFFPYTQARMFTSTPTYSEGFFKADKVRKDYLSAPTEDAYTGRIDFNIRAVEPLSFRGSPAPVV